jgi:hypothetical protein
MQRRSLMVLLQLPTVFSYLLNGVGKNGLAAIMLHPRHLFALHPFPIRPTLVIRTPFHELGEF